MTEPQDTLTSRVMAINTALVAAKEAVCRVAVEAGGMDGLVQVIRDHYSPLAETWTLERHGIPIATVSLCTSGSLVSVRTEWHEQGGAHV